MAHIRRLPSGKWNAVVRHPSGRRVTKTDPLRRVVVTWAQEIEAALRNGQDVTTDRRLTVRQWEAKWTASRNVDRATAAKNRSHMDKHVLPQWGDWPLRSIGRLDVQTWVKDMTASGSGAPTVTAAYNLFSKMLADAVLEQKLGASPCREIDLPKVVKPTPRWLTEEEYGRIQLALGEQLHGEVWQAFVGLGSYSGLRPGELAGLDVEHLDFDRSLVRVQQVMTRYGLRGYPKSDTSVRSVPFPPEVGAMLWRLVADRSQGAVFTSAMGQRVSETNFRNRVWKRALADAGVAYGRPYLMRHTCASWLVQRGVPPIEIVRMLGHSSMALVNTYLHLAPDQHDRIRAAWGAAAEIADPWVAHAEA